MQRTKATITRKIYRHRCLPVSAFLIFSALFAASQNTRRPVASTAPTTNPLSGSAAQARRDQLAKIPELLADPDPNARVANMEGILNTNDATMIQTALRLAFRSDDANLRSLALRAYIANMKELTFDVLVPAQVERQYEAVQDDPSKRDAFFKSYNYIRYLESAGFKAKLVFIRYNSTDSTGAVRDSTRDMDSNVFTISGDRLTTKVRTRFSLACYFDIRPSNDMTLHGTMACEDNNGPFPRLGISAPIF